MLRMTLWSICSLLRINSPCRGVGCVAESVLTSAWVGCRFPPPTAPPADDSDGGVCRGGVSFRVPAGRFVTEGVAVAEPGEPSIVAPDPGVAAAPPDELAPEVDPPEPDEAPCAKADADRMRAPARADETMRMRMSVPVLV
jgi:hypothetical protein